MNLWQQLSLHIQRATNTDFTILTHSSVGGGCINQAYKVSNGQQCYFVKLNTSQFAELFKAEALSLQALTSSATVRIPQPVCYGQIDSQAYLVMEYLDLSGRIDSVALGQQLAAMHRHSQPGFGWNLDNTIGSTPQFNQPTDNWPDFWTNQRLLPQLQLAQRNGYAAHLSAVEKLLTNFAPLFKNYQPQPSMLHGDLWGGNAAALADGTPVIFDPAFYYGDRETDLAMTCLFGGFDSSFYAAYNQAWPLDDGFKLRKSFYNLYHILNHLNLFGRSYLGQAVSMAEQVLAEI